MLGVVRSSSLLPPCNACTHRRGRDNKITSFLLSSADDVGARPAAAGGARGQRHAQLRRGVPPGGAHLLAPRRQDRAAQGKVLHVDGAGKAELQGKRREGRNGRMKVDRLHFAIMEAMVQ